MEQASTFNFPTTAPNLMALDFFFTRSSDKENLCRDLTTEADNSPACYFWMSQNNNVTLNKVQGNHSYLSNKWFLGFF